MELFNGDEEHKRRTNVTECLNLNYNMVREHSNRRMLGFGFARLEIHVMATVKRGPQQLINLMEKEKNEINIMGLWMGFIGVLILKDSYTCRSRLIGEMSDRPVARR